MNNKLLEPAEITLRIHGQTYKVDNIDWDCSAEDLIEQFKGLMVAGGFTPTVLNSDYGRWEWQEYEKSQKPEL